MCQNRIQCNCGFPYEGEYKSSKLKLTYTSGILDSHERLGAMTQFLALCDISQTPAHGPNLLKNQIQDGEFFWFCSLFDKEIQNSIAPLNRK